MKTITLEALLEQLDEHSYLLEFDESETFTGPQLFNRFNGTFQTVNASRTLVLTPIVAYTSEPHSLSSDCAVIHHESRRYALMQGSFIQLP